MYNNRSSAPESGCTAKAAVEVLQQSESNVQLHGLLRLKDANNNNNKCVYLCALLDAVDFRLTSQLMLRKLGRCYWPD